MHGTKESAGERRDNHGLQEKRRDEEIVQQRYQIGAAYFLGKEVKRVNEHVNLLFRENAGKIRISSPFGYRTDPISGVAGVTHDGNDYAPTPAGTHYPTYSIAPGIVYSCGTDSTGGKFVWVTFPELSKAAVYYHLDSIAVVKGQTVQLGTKIGNIGTTGRSTGVHLHFGWCPLEGFSTIWKNNKWEDFEKQELEGNTMANTFDGIDVSKHQGVIDWTAVKASGVKFAIVRAGWSWYNGGINIDSCFERNMQQAIASGLDVGVYVYAYDLTPEAARIAAQRTLEIIKPYKLTYPVFYDQEYEACLKALDRQRRTDNCKAFMDTIEAAGYYSGLYASKDWLENWVYPDQLTAYDKWVAQYASACTYTGAYGIWQYKGGQGTCSGIAGACDRDISYKDYPTIIAKAGLNNLDTSASVPDATVAFEPVSGKVATVISTHCELFNTPDIYDVARKLELGEQLPVIAISVAPVGAYTFLQVADGYIASISSNVLVEDESTAIKPEENPEQSETNQPQETAPAEYLVSVPATLTAAQVQALQAAGMVVNALTAD